MINEPTPNADIDPLQLLGTEVVIANGQLLWETNEVPDVLWHYTDAAGALGVLRGRALWATHALFMNDASELRIAYPLLQDEIDAAEKKLAGNAVLRNLTTALGVMISDQGRDPDVYAVCFCEHGDLLSQWRAYGRAGGGYALGLDSAALLTDANRTVGLSLSRVIYDEGRQRELAKALVEQTIAIYSRYVKLRPDHEGKALAVVARSFAYGAQTYAYRIKDGAFSEENEWRLIYARDPEGSFEPAERSFRTGDRGLLPYVEIPARPSNAPGSEHLRLDLGLNSLPVRTVRVGPTAHPATTELAIRYLLHDLDLAEVEVQSSSIPLRA